VDSRLKIAGMTMMKWFPQFETIIWTGPDNSIGIFNKLRDGGG
jgi:hypothetical protein